MTGKELLQALQQMDSNELNYIVLIGMDECWIKLETITKDFDAKTLDLEGEKKDG